MAFVDSIAAPLLERAMATAEAANTGTRPLRRAPACALVLFVGGSSQPSAADREGLARDGMRSLWLPTIEQAKLAARQARFDALVLDQGLLDGREGSTLARLRETVRCPVVLVADNADEVDEILALELGADAFLARPLAPRRLRAHLAALLRLRQARLPAEEAPAPRVVDPAADVGAAWRLDTVGNRLFRGDAQVALTEVQAAMLQVLLEAAGRIVPRERLIASLPVGQSVGARSVDVYIHRLRKRLLEGGAAELSIEAVRGRGYRLHRQSS
jgi:DNA-binding response OmpR family regulator